MEIKDVPGIITIGDSFYFVTITVRVSTVPYDAVSDDEAMRMLGYEVVGS